MKAAQVDPRQRFTAVYEAHYGAIQAYMARRVGRQVADELTAETFLVAWRRLDALPSEPLPWLYGIARNVAARQYATLSRRQRAEAALASERSTEQAPFAEAGDPALWEAWEGLRPGDREVLSLIAWEDLPVAQAARVLGCPAAVFSVRLHRARRRFERLLARRVDRPVPVTELSEA